MATLREALTELLRSISADEPPRARGSIFRREEERRGIQLLIDHLSPEQRAQYEKRGYFEVTGGDTGRRYRIRRGSQMNVEALDRNSCRVHLLCFMPEGRIPLGDIMLAQKIALELFEREALGVANRAPMWDYASEEGPPFLRRYPRR